MSLLVAKDGKHRSSTNASHSRPHSVKAMPPTVDPAQRKMALSRLDANVHKQARASPATTTQMKTSRPALHNGPAFQGFEDSPTTAARTGKSSRRSEPTAKHGRTEPVPTRRSDEDVFAAWTTEDGDSERHGSVGGEDVESRQDGDDAASHTSDESGSVSWTLEDEQHQGQAQPVADPRMDEAKVTVSDVAERNARIFDEQKEGTPREFRDVAENVASCYAKGVQLAEGLMAKLDELEKQADRARDESIRVITDVQDKGGKLNARIVALVAQLAFLAEKERQSKQAFVVKLTKLRAEQRKDLEDLQTETVASVQRFNADIVEALNDKALKREMQKRFTMFLAS